MGYGLARYESVLFHENVTTGSTPVGTPTAAHGFAFLSVQVSGLGTGAGGVGDGAGTIRVEGTLAMESTTTTWVPMTVTNVESNATQNNIVANGIYTTTQLPFMNFVRVRVVTTSWLTGSGLSVYGKKQSQTAG